MPYIYSSLTADNEYSTPAGEIVIYGRLGSQSNRAIMTPRGMATRVEDADIEALNHNPVFQSHVKNQYITIERKELSETKAAKLIESGDLQLDPSAQETAETLKRKPGRPAVKQGG